jgi:hypothetical protein
MKMDLVQASVNEQGLGLIEAGPDLYEPHVAWYRYTNVNKTNAKEIKAVGLMYLNCLFWKEIIHRETNHKGLKAEVKRYRFSWMPVTGYHDREEPIRGINYWINKKYDQHQFSKEEKPWHLIYSDGPSAHPGQVKWEGNLLECRNLMTKLPSDWYEVNQKAEEKLHRLRETDRDLTLKLLQQDYERREELITKQASLPASAPEDPRIAAMEAQIARMSELLEKQSSKVADVSKGKKNE